MSGSCSSCVDTKYFYINICLLVAYLIVVRGPKAAHIAPCVDLKLVPFDSLYIGHTLSL